MSGKNPRLKALESRKQLLIAESELNRAHLLHELDTMAVEIHGLANQAKTINWMASAAALLISGLSSFRSKNSAPGAERSPWWQTILKGAGVVSSLWSEFRSQDHSKAK